MSKETGGPAFPSEWKFEHNGMSLRDYLAAKAMQALLARASTEDEKWGFNQTAMFSYELADAMLKEREK